MKKNRDNEGTPLQLADKWLQKSPAEKNRVFLVLAIVLLAVSFIPRFRHVIVQNTAPFSADVTGKYVWVTGSPDNPAGLYLFSAEQLENDIPAIGSLLATGTVQENNSVISAIQYNADTPRLVKLPPEVANIFFRPIPINRANEDILTSLPGIGPVLAGKIVQRRNEYGPFRSMDELLHISGIGPKKFENLVDRIILD